jgi:V8-like Glu-specific endopeptidase
MGFKDEIGFGSTIRISGYPSKDYLACVPLYNANFKRKDLVGNLIHIYNHVIFHEMETEKGHSGGPIFAINSLGEVIIIGLHTHKGKDNCNKGIFFND